MERPDKMTLVDKIISISNTIRSAEFTEKANWVIVDIKTARLISRKIDRDEKIKSILD